MRKFKITVDGQPYVVEVEEVSVDANVEITKKSEPAAAKATAPVKARTEAAKPDVTAVTGEKIIAPMPGTILDLKFKDGDTVKKGDVIVILEAMKMENEIVSTVEGVIKYAVSKGANVATGDTIAVL